MIHPSIHLNSQAIEFKAFSGLATLCLPLSTDLKHRLEYQEHIACASSLENGDVISCAREITCPRDIGSLLSSHHDCPDCTNVQGVELRDDRGGTTHVRSSSLLHCRKSARVGCRVEFHQSHPSSRMIQWIIGKLAHCRVRS